MLKVVAGIISANNGKILIAQRGSGMHFEGFWEFPGGKIELGEDPKNALKREIKEELELDINVEEKVHSWAYNYDFGTINFTAYRASIKGGELKTLEHMATAWVEPSELKNYKMVPADLELAELICGGNS
ncbi:MAG TPA: (deoxy)nucleoside triphosphate pyrophosphohydrolase [bacterium]|nr:(deoxy)nucleoside triphosphate pyrophosphohydrolase [bacterium]